MAYRPRLKICGVTNGPDARLVTQSGADYCGILVDVGFSERSLSLGEAREVAAASGVKVVVLLCDPPQELVEKVVGEIAPYAVQLLCRESPDLIRALRPRVKCQIWKTLHLPAATGQATAEEYVAAGVDAFLLDSSDSSEGFLRLGGTGTVIDWGQAAAVIRQISKPVFLAGGINADNVASALFKVRPYGIDLCSGVELTKGRKDPVKLRRLVDNFSAAVAEIEESAG
jgi:phosphoribosylanthranilate isomerase